MISLQAGMGGAGPLANFEMAEPCHPRIAIFSREHCGRLLPGVGEII
jgi:hypothetical protein